MWKTLTYTVRYRFLLGCSNQPNVCDVVLQNGVRVSFDFFDLAVKNGWIASKDFKEVC